MFVHVSKSLKQLVQDSNLKWYDDDISHTPFEVN